MKDFKNTYDQKKWEFAVAGHTRWKQFLERAIFPESIAYAKERIAEYEKAYPQLKATP